MICGRHVYPPGQGTETCGAEYGHEPPRRPMTPKEKEMKAGLERASEKLREWERSWSVTIVPGEHVHVEVCSGREYTGTLYIAPSGYDVLLTHRRAMLIESLFGSMGMLSPLPVLITLWTEVRKIKRLMRKPVRGKK